MSEQSMYGQIATERADQAGLRFGEEHRTEVLGEGLSAIAYAILELADAIRSYTDAQRRYDD